ncbi:MAG TPA: hypothetical protein VKY89_07520 [Thermoanaerobaculia bacterium]|jgi:arabinofuranosyltransferase|nr:hypothetical protein [Thermoanaerobaculia bacterium]
MARDDLVLPAPPPAPRAEGASLWLLAAAMLLAVAGWKLFWFLTDDAYITFRYVANLIAGYGLVWNPPPFLPVEGYTSFLWALVLAAVWRLTGLEPPRTACFLTLLCGLATLAIVWRALGRLRLSPRLERARTLLSALALLGICTNRTFLTWLSSGLETQLFNLCFTWWAFEALGLLGGEESPAWLLRLSGASALAALARPDGLLTVPVTAVLALASVRQAGRPWRPARLLAASPLLAVAAHLLWRRRTYGEWAPNTYYAKVPAPWPAMGWRYLASFVVENGAWVWLLLAILAAAAAWRRERWWAAGRLARWLVPAVVLAHVSYYTLIVGGDHFEYRVFSYLIPLLFVSAVALLDAAGLGAAAGAALLGIFLLASYPLPWLHWWRTRELATRDQTRLLRWPLAPDFPPPLRSVVAAWDGWQAALIAHAVGARHQEHKVFHDWVTAQLPARQEGARIPWSGRPVLVAPGVGVVGWVLPHVAIIDSLGLNDRVIAHTPLPPGRRHRWMMAHERQAPPGYLDCFLPNVVLLGGGQVRVDPRPVPLTDDRIRACERRDWPPPR